MFAFALGRIFVFGCCQSYALTEKSRLASQGVGRSPRRPLRSPVQSLYRPLRIGCYRTLPPPHLHPLSSLLPLDGKGCCFVHFLDEHLSQVPLLLVFQCLRCVAPYPIFQGLRCVLLSARQSG